MLSKNLLPGWAASRAPFSLSLILLLFYALLPAETFEYNRLAVSNGELWRLLTAHLVHTEGSHFLLNLAGLVLVWVFFANLASARDWLACLLAVSLFTSVMVYLWLPDLMLFVGLSGVLHGLFTYGLWRDWSLRRAEAVMLLLIVSAKLGWEQLMGPLPGSEQAAGGPVLVEAHLYGALGGILYGGLRQAWRAWHRRE